MINIGLFSSSSLFGVCLLISKSFVCFGNGILWYITLLWKDPEFVCVGLRSGVFLRKTRGVELARKNSQIKINTIFISLLFRLWFLAESSFVWSLLLTLISGGTFFDKYYLFLASCSIKRRRSTFFLIHQSNTILAIFCLLSFSYLHKSVVF